jgi:uncharacterized protein
MAEQSGDREPVTMVYTWDVTGGREAAFEEWARALSEVASRFPGHLGATWFRPEDMGSRYYTVVRFSDEERMRAWLSSPERSELIERVHGTATEYRGYTVGLEAWFNLPGQGGLAPPRWKMALVTFCAIYPLSVLFQRFVTPSTASWPFAVRALLLPAAVVPLLTFLLMPWLTRLISAWLYPPQEDRPPARPGGRREPLGRDR